MIRKTVFILFAGLTILMVGLFSTSAPSVRPVSAATNSFSLSVISARTEPKAFGGVGVIKGDPIGEYKYIINVDNTGVTTQRSPADGCSPADPGYPGSCLWTSIAGVAGSSPVYTQGNQDDFNGVNGTSLNLPDGRYLISVLADGYKLDGVHFTMPLPDSGLVTVELQPQPLPTATIHAFIFEDISPTNGAPDVPLEHGLPGFVGHIADYLGEVTTDVFGNPLCTEYKTDGSGQIILDPPDYAPIPIPGTGGECVSDANGDLIIPNLGPNRYALSAVAPDGTNWIQTTTLEGNHDWDAWVMEGATGLDTEFIVAGEPFPAIIFGFVHPTPALPSGPGGHIKGVIEGVKVYVPPKGGTGLPGTIWGGSTGMKLDQPIENPWISLTDLTNGDTAIYVGQGDANGAFDISNVPDGNYTLTWWDEPQNYILDLINVTVSNGETVDMGILPLTGWWTKYDGYVFNDLNRNGVKDPGEPGIPNFGLTMRKRENSLMDRGATAVTTDATGYYIMENAYPMTQWLVMEAYNDLYYTTGVTYQADNQATPTTVLGAGVDISVLPIIGLSGRLDWGVHAYDATGNNGVDPRNGGIVGTVSYDTTRNELDARYAFVEDWQPGISDITVNLYQPMPCGTTGGPCDPTGRYKLNPDGSYARGILLNTYVTETWERPTGCVARDVDGNPLTYPADQQVLPTDPNADCLEGPLMGVQFGTYATDQGTPDANFGASVDGNYGFGDGCFTGTLDATDPANPICVGGAFEPLPGGRDYLVEVAIPNDALGRPLFKVTREEDINIGNGDQFIPQVPPPACAGPLHTVDVANNGVDGYPANTTFIPGVTVPASEPTLNPTFEGITSPYEGTPKPLCDTKLVPLNNGRSIVPTFNLFTDVPVPGRFWGLIVDDLNFSGNPQSLLYGEKAGVPFAPVGIYDYTNRLVTTVESDYNGLWDVLLPSTNRINCPTPSGVCANLYRFVGNDPGTPGQLNLNYKPQFRTIAAEFEAIPGLLVPADLAPTQVGVSVQLPGGQVNQISCSLDSATPQLFTVSQPYVNGSGSFTINGFGFGDTPGQVTLDGTIILPTTAWSNTQITANVPVDTPIGPHQLSIKAANGQSTINGLTFHVLGSNAGPFPSTPVLDAFNRNGIGQNWSADNAFSLNSNSVRVTGTGTMRWTGNAGGGPVYAANQEAYFTFNEVSPVASEQGLFLKITGNGNNPNPTSTSSAYIEVSYKATNPTSVQVRTKANGTNTVVLRATFGGVTFGTNDTLGARALADGTVIAYKNGVQIGTVNVTSGSNPWTNAAGNGRLGIRFVGAQNSNINDARFDNFGGGSIVILSYLPHLFEVGPGHTYATIQSAIDAAQVGNDNSLVVVYPGQPDLSNPRANPRGAYYENLIINSPIKLQGVGPGGFQGTTFVPGAIIDGGAFAGDGVVAANWYVTLDGLTWDGNQTVFDGAVVSIFAHDGDFTDGYKASIDGFDLRGGDQQGFPGNINVIGGGTTGLPPNLITQGGAVFANGYARYLQITNNMIQNNGGAYGTVRLGTPDLPAPDTNNHNENVRIANNRIIANGGTNLAGGIGLFAGADNYEVVHNDICGNFSAEYGGGLTVYGYSPNGSIHDNRIYFNASYDEGGGIMIAGELPADPTLLSPGSGPVDIFGNLIQANLANDDGGGVRFLMAGNFPMNVYNNMIVNNISTHEGGGIGLNDAPNVRVYNNTIMKNLTTATAVTSNGQAAPAGLSTSQNSDMLQATLPGGSPIFSDPLLFNNIFWDNRAGTRAGATVVGLGLPGDASTINHWDLGTADGTGLLSPTNSVLQTGFGVIASPTNVLADPIVIATYDTSVTFNVWRNNPNFVGAILVAVDLPANLLGDYHIPLASPANDAGAASKGAINAPTVDIDGDGRPSGAGFEIGADEIGPGTAARADGIINGHTLSFPTTGLLDNFNRGAGASTPLGVNWMGATNTNQFRINSNTVQMQTASGSIWWRTPFGANQEAYLTLVGVGSNTNITPRWQGLLLKFNGTDPNSLDASAINVLYRASTGVTVRTKAPGGVWVDQITLPIAYATGDVMGARAQADGLVSVYKNGVLVGLINIAQGSKAWPADLVQGGGWIGATNSMSNGRFDNFSGGTMP